MSRARADRRRAWCGAYVDTILGRDVRELASVEKLVEMPRLLQLLAARSSGLLNHADLSSGLSLSQSTVRRYLALLEAVLLVRLVAAWSGNLSVRLAKSPKVHLVDSGLAAAVLGADRARLESDGGLRGRLLESFVTMELVRLWSGPGAGVFHFRTSAGREVDAVLESADGRVVGVEVKSGSTVRSNDLRGLGALREAAGERIHRGVVLYEGEQVIPFGSGIWAVPLRGLWG